VSLPASITAEACEKHNRLLGYAGDIGVEEAWKLLEKKADAVLVDVRTPQEWEQIGLPDLASLGKIALRLSWSLLPPGETGSQFVSEFSHLQVADDTPVLLICRSGGRSRAAAMALTQGGYRCCFNIAAGFEGPNGWKANQLPWKQ